MDEYLIVKCIDFWRAAALNIVIPLYKYIVMIYIYLLIWVLVHTKWTKTDRENDAN